jgi:hypothetical protein
MSKLKTLKDVGELMFSEEELKAEAIKWIKEDYSLVVNKETHIMLERWKNRFNLTEEDLK